MRYFIETLEQEATIGRKISEWKSKGYINIIEKGDPIDEIKTEVIKIQRVMATLEKVGIDNSVMMAYLRVKTTVPKLHIEAVLLKQKEFFKKLRLL